MRKYAFIFLTVLAVIWMLSLASFMPFSNSAIASGPTPQREFIAIRQILFRHFYFRNYGFNFAPQPGYPLSLCSSSNLRKLKVEPIPVKDPFVDKERLKTILGDPPCLLFSIHFHSRTRPTYFSVNYAHHSFVSRLEETVMSAQFLNSAATLEMNAVILEQFWKKDIPRDLRRRQMTDADIFAVWKNISQMRLVKLGPCVEVLTGRDVRSKFQECYVYEFL